MTAPLELPPEVPLDRVWLPVDGPEGAQRALDRLYLLRRTQWDSPREQETDVV